RATDDERVEPCARTHVHDPFTGYEWTDRERVPDTGEGLDGDVRERRDRVGVVAELGREAATGVEVVLGAGFDGNCAVLRLHFGAQRIGVDPQALSVAHVPTRCS